MAQDQSRYWTPSRTYEFVLKIGKIDLTPDLISLKILTSLDLPYQTFVLDIFMDPNDVILEQIYGQTPLTLTSNLFATSPSMPQEQIIFELMYLASDMPLQTSVQVPENIQKDRSPVSLTCVAKKAYKTMNYFVNSVYQGKTIETVISDLVNKTGATLKMDTQGKNSEAIDQILVPPSTLYKNVRYLNRTFGVFDGMMGFYCNHDNTVYVKNLTNKIARSDTFIIYQLPLGNDNTEIIKKCNDGKHYYTQQDLMTKYKGNSAFAFLAPTMKHVVKPSDRLYHTIDLNLEEFSQNYGLISKGNKIFFDTQTLNPQDRISIHKDHTGYELSETFIRAKYSRRVSSITEMAVHVEQSIKLMELMNVGESVKIDTMIDSSRDFTGNYILKASQLNFTKAKDWESSADLFLSRTNRTIT